MTDTTPARHVSITIEVPDKGEIEQADFMFTIEGLDSDDTTLLVVMAALTLSNIHAKALIEELSPGMNGEVVTNLANMNARLNLLDAIVHAPDVQGNGMMTSF